MKRKEIKEGLFILLFTFIVFGGLMISNWFTYIPAGEIELPYMDTISEDSCDCEEEKYSVVTVTKYNPVIAQCDSDPLITADGSYIDTIKLNKRELRWIAISRDLLKDYQYGDTVYLSSLDNKIDGYYVVRDTMNKRWTNRVDILSPCDDSLGKWEDVCMFKIERE